MLKIFDLLENYAALRPQLSEEQMRILNNTAAVTFGSQNREDAVALALLSVASKDEKRTSKEIFDSAAELLENPEKLGMAKILLTRIFSGSEHKGVGR